MAMASSFMVLAPPFMGCSRRGSCCARRARGDDGPYGRAQVTDEDGHRDLHEDREDQEPYPEDARRDAPFDRGRRVRVDLTQGGRREAWDDEPHALLDVDAGPDEEEAHVEGDEVPAGARDEEQHECRGAAAEREPGVRHEREV